MYRNATIEDQPYVNLFTSDKNSGLYIQNKRNSKILPLENKNKETEEASNEEIIVTKKNPVIVRNE